MAKKNPSVDVANGDIHVRGNYSDVLKKIVADGNCPFCEKNLSKTHPKPILFTNKSWVVTTNAWPYEGSKKHFLLIARAHIEDAADGTPALWKDLGAAYARICKEYKLQGATLFMRSGSSKLTGASVKHLHAQLVVGAPRNAVSEPILAVVGFKK